MKFIYLAIPILFLLVTSCASLKLNPPSPDKQTILVLPVRVTFTKDRTSRHGYYYIYEIISDPDEIVSLDTRVNTYKAVFKLPIKGDMLIVDSLPPGNYLVDKFIFKPVGAGDFTYGNNVIPRNDKFKLEAGKVTIFSISLEVSLDHSTQYRVTSYAFNMVSVSPDQRENILATLKNYQTLKLGTC